MADRNELRKYLLSSKHFRSERVNLFGQEIELRQPSVKDALALAEAAEGKDNQSSLFLIEVLIRYAYVPGTNERVFEEGDREAILQWPVGDWMKEVADKFNSLGTIDLEEARKN